MTSSVPQNFNYIKLQKTSFIHLWSKPFAIRFLKSACELEMVAEPSFKNFCFLKEFGLSI